MLLAAGVVSDRRIQTRWHQQIRERGVSLDLVSVTEQRRRKASLLVGSAQTVEEDDLFHSGQVWTFIPRHSETAAGLLLPARLLRKGRQQVGPVADIAAGRRWQKTR